MSEAITKEVLKDFRPLEGTILYTSRHQIEDNTDMLNYSHLMLRAWRDLKLSSILCIDGLPTLYLRQDKRKISAAYANKLHLEFWNQGIATVLILVDPRVVRVYSGLATPVAPDDDTDRPSCLIETLRTADLAIRWNQIATELATGQFYRAHPDKFDPEKAVDAYLLENLGNVRDFLTEGPHALPAKMAHAFLGRVLFACYLIDRRVVNLSDYDFADGTTKLIDLLKLPNSPTFTDAKTRLYRLFEDLAVKFNGSMFDKDLIGEKRLIRKSHLDAVVHFLRGGSNQGESTYSWILGFRFQVDTCRDDQRYLRRLPRERGQPG